jgi:hypothetical protein
MPIGLAGILAGNIPLRARLCLVSCVQAGGVPVARQGEEGKLESRNGCNEGDILLRCGRRGGDTQVFQLGPRAALFFGAWVALDDFAEFADPGIFLA